MQLMWTQAGEYTTNDIVVDLPRQESGVQSYDFVLYEYDADAASYVGKELGRLNDAIEVTVDGAAVSYDMGEFVPEAGQYKITLGTAPENGAVYLNQWLRGTRKYWSLHRSDGTAAYQETTFMGALQDGDIYDLRALSSLELDGQTLKATITPPSTKTYTAPAAGSLEWSGSANSLNLTWNPVANTAWYLVSILNGDNSVFNMMITTPSFNLYSSICDWAGEENAAYTIIVTALDSDRTNISTVGTLKNAIDLNISGAQAEYSFEITGEKTYSLTLANSTPDGYRNWRWSNSAGADKDFVGSSSGLSYSDYSRYYAFADGDMINVRIVTASNIADSTISLTVTPSSIQTYKITE